MISRVVKLGMDQQRAEELLTELFRVIKNKYDLICTLEYYGFISAYMGKQLRGEK
jgi:hypothetical protein